MRCLIVRAVSYFVYFINEISKDVDCRLVVSTQDKQLTARVVENFTSIQSLRCCRFRPSFLEFGFQKDNQQAICSEYAFISIHRNRKRPELI